MNLDLLERARRPFLALTVLSILLSSVLGMVEAEEKGQTTPVTLLNQVASNGYRVVLTDHSPDRTQHKSVSVDISSPAGESLSMFIVNNSLSSGVLALQVVSDPPSAADSFFFQMLPGLQGASLNEQRNNGLIRVIHPAAGFVPNSAAKPSIPLLLDPDTAYPRLAEYLRGAGSPWFLVQAKAAMTELQVAPDKAKPLGPAKMSWIMYEFATSVLSPPPSCTLAHIWHCSSWANGIFSAWATYHELSGIQ